MTYHNAHPKPEKRAKKPKKPLKRTAIKKKRTVTGERAVNLKIWAERPHYCEHCNVYLGEEPLAYYFSHEVRKSKDNSKRLDPANIFLHCLVCHRAKDQGTKEQYEKRNDLYVKPLA